MPQQNPRYTYEDAGFNGFLSRSLKANPLAQTVNQGIALGSGTPLNVDMQQLFGALGNKVKIGRIMLNGIDGRIEMSDENGVDTSWYGDLT